MKKQAIRKQITCLLIIGSIAGYAAAQGSLTPPPGAPAPTMKTLDEIEARTPISSAVTTITAPGSYYLTRDLITGSVKSALTIAASDVVVDLNGFSISAQGGASGISIASSKNNVVIEGGTIRDSSANGIYAYGSSNCVFRNLTVLGNCQASSSYAGIIAGNASRIERCRIIGNAGYGLKAYAGSTIEDNEIIGNTSAGLKLYGTESILNGNIVKGNGDNYDLAADNQLNLLICEIPETIEWPCSVKLACTLTCSQTGVDGIVVAADNVTIDLAGNTLVGPGASSGNGIYQSDSYDDLTVLNGRVVHWEGYAKSGIRASGDAARIENVASDHNDYGIIVGVHGTVRNCTAFANGLGGIQGTDFCLLENNHCRNNGFDTGYGGGIHANGRFGRISDNIATGNARGIYVSDIGNFIVRNRAGGNMLDYYIVSSNKVGVITAPPNSPAITSSATIGLAIGVGTTDPWSNFLY